LNKEEQIMRLKLATRVFRDRTGLTRCDLG